MPLFKCRVIVQATAEIAVEANSEEEARRYLSGTNEWHEDGAIQHMENDKLTVSNIERVTNPAEMREFESDTLIWTADKARAGNATVTHAFFELPLFPAGDCSDEELYDFDDSVELKKKEWDQLRGKEK